MDQLKNNQSIVETAASTRIIANRESAYPDEPSSPQLARQETSINSISSYSSLNSLKDKDIDSSGSLPSNASQQCRDNSILPPESVATNWQNGKTNFQFQMFTTQNYLPYSNLPRPSLSSASFIPITGQSSPVMPSSPFARSQQNYVPSNASGNPYLQSKSNTVIYTNANIAGRPK